MRAAASDGVQGEMEMVVKQHQQQRRRRRRRGAGSYRD